MITAKPLAQAQYAPDSVATIYAAPGNTRTIIDKFSATNTDSSSRTISVHVVQAGGSPGASNLITSAKSVGAGVSVDLEEMKNQILGPGDFIAVVASVASKVVVRASGREVT